MKNNGMVNELSRMLPCRKPDSHKGDYGHVFVIAGSKGLTGAAALCSAAALRVGAGLVTLGIPASLNSIMEIKLTEVMTLPLSETPEGSLSLKAKDDIMHFQKKCDCLVIGPGLSRNRKTQRLVRYLINKNKGRIIIDADGVNALKDNLNMLEKSNAEIILTPHLGEFSELIDVPVETIRNNRNSVVKKFVMQYNPILVLKGYKTIVAKRNRKTYINNTGNSGMATAGSGDVLTGMIGGFIAQGLGSFEATKLAVYLHGLAGDLAAKEKTKYSLIASDILDNIPQAIRILLNC